MREEKPMQLKNIAYTLLIAGTAAVVATSPSFAAKKKAKSYAEDSTPVCLQPQKAVCGMKGTQKFTYASACFALKDGAKIVGDSACAGGKKMMKKKMSMKKPMKKGDKAKKM
jgi:hypothetical protein